MRILVYGLNAAPEPIGVGKYSGELASWLAKQGHGVRMISAPPYYPAWRVAPGYKASRYGRENRAGVTIYRCPLWVPSQPSGILRILHLLSFTFSSLPIALWQGFMWKPNAIIAIAPTMLVCPTVWIIARLSGAVAWLHVQDFEVDMAFELGMVGGSRLRSLMLRVERFVFRRFDRVSSISRKMCEALLMKGVASTRVSYFPNWVDVHAICPLKGPNRFRQELGIESDTIVALYAGNMANKQGIETLVDTARILVNHSNICFIFAGDGVARSDLEAKTENLPNVRFLPLQPAEKLNELLNLADLHVLPQRRGAADLVMPSKLSGMLASGRPVVAGADSKTQIADAVSGCGRLVPPEDAEAMARAIVDLAEKPEERRALGRVAREAAIRKWNKETILMRFSDELFDLTDANDQYAHSHSVE